jgi:hypothetical protein
MKLENDLSNWPSYYDIRHCNVWETFKAILCCHTSSSGNLLPSLYNKP